MINLQGGASLFILLINRIFPYQIKYVAATLFAVLLFYFSQLGDAGAKPQGDESSAELNNEKQKSGRASYHKSAAAESTYLHSDPNYNYDYDYNVSSRNYPWLSKWLAVVAIFASWRRVFA